MAHTNAGLVITAARKGVILRKQTLAEDLPRALLHPLRKFVSNRLVPLAFITLAISRFQDAGWRVVRRLNSVRPRLHARIAAATGLVAPRSSRLTNDRVFVAHVPFSLG